MHQRIFFDNRISQISEAQIPAFSSAALYGRAVFTTVAIYNEKPFLWNLHWQRLINNAERVGINLNQFSENTVREALLALVSANKIERGRARLTFFDGRAGQLWKYESETDTKFLIMTADSKALRADGARLTVSPFKINSASPLAGVKSCNYLENLLALENAKSNGFDEAVRTNERGEIASVAMANLFWTKENKIFTPFLQTGALAGTTRDFVFRLARELDLEIAEVSARLDVLESAEEIFITSAGSEIRFIETFGGKTYKSFLTKKLQKAFAENLKSFAN